MLQRILNDFIERDKDAGTLPRILLVLTTQHDEARTATYVDALKTYAHVSVDIIRPVPEMLDHFPRAANGAYDFSMLTRTYDGVVMSGGRPNVAPEFYGMPPEFDDSPHDLARDILSIGIAQQMPSDKPVLGICLGMQQMAVAHGAKLKKVEEHGPPNKENTYGPAHGLKIPHGSLFHMLSPTAAEIFGRSRLAELAARVAQFVAGKKSAMSNSVHWRAIDEASIISIAPGTERIHVIAHAPDDTVEAIHINGTNMIGVQNHPEKDVATNAHSRRLFAAFGLMARRRLDLRKDGQFNTFMRRFLTRQHISLRTATSHAARHLTAAKG